MENTKDLEGQRILLVEDNFLIASDTAAALLGAGAEVVGPCCDEAQARAMLTGRPPTTAILDINLGSGCPHFGLARLMFERGIPFLFLSGYDPEVVPDDLARVPWVQKPASADRLVAAAQQLFAAPRELVATRPCPIASATV